MGVDWGRALMGGLNGGAKAFNTVLDERRKDAMQARRDLRLQGYALEQIEAKREPKTPSNPSVTTVYDEQGNMHQSVWQDGKKISSMVGVKSAKTKGSGSQGEPKTTNWNSLAEKAFPDDPYLAGRAAAVAERIKQNNPDLGDAQVFFRAQNFIKDNPSLSDKEIDEVIAEMPGGVFWDSDQEKQDKKRAREWLQKRSRSIEPIQSVTDGGVSIEEARQSPDKYREYMRARGVSEAQIEQGIKKNFAQPNSVGNTQEKPSITPTPTPTNDIPTTKPQPVVSEDESTLLQQIATIDKKIAALPNKNIRHGRSLMMSPDYKVLYQRKKALEQQLHAIRFQQNLNNIKNR